MADTNDSKRKVPSADVGSAFEVEVPAMKNQRQRNISDEESFSLNNERSLALVTPRENHFSSKSWWMVDLSCVGETSPHGATALVKRCMRVHGWDETKARKVLAAYRQFLTLKKIRQDWNAEIFSPCYLVDQMWHCHILDVMNYCHDMMLLCGHVVGHNPDGALDIEAKEKRDHDTRVCLLEEFGEYDKEVWDYSPHASAARAVNDRNAQNVASGNSNGRSNEGHDIPNRDRETRRTSNPSLAESRDAAGGDPGSERANENITFMIKDQNGEETMFRIKRTYQIGNVFDAYAGRKRVSVCSFRFLYYGETIDFHETPNSLDLEDGDQIDCILQLQGC